MLMSCRTALLAIVLILLAIASGCACSQCHDTPESSEPMAAEPMEDTFVPDSAPAGTMVSTTDGGLHVVYRVMPDPVPLNEMFSIQVDIYEDAECTTRATDVGLAVDARMPHHRHGMNRRPSLTQSDNGGTLVNGMLFHMPGRWELYFDLTQDGVTQRAMDVIMLD